MDEEGLQALFDRVTSTYAATDETHDEARWGAVAEEKRRTGRGIEVGHIFYFGDKYSAAMGLKVSGPDGSMITPMMGSYGVGVSRLVGAIIEASHDDAGIIWPEPVAPWRVGLVTMRADDEPSAEAAEKVYGQLRAAGIDVLYDDRDETLKKVTEAAGFLWAKGAIDFAGGTVVHINAGIAGLVGAYMLGKRVGFGREAMTPHSLTMTMIGASLLWVGWFGFNVGSNLEATGTAALAFANTLVATAAATVSWMFFEWIFKGKPSMLGAASGAIAGLVAITPACGWVGPMGAIIIGLLAGVVCLWAVNGLKRMLGADDALDVFGVHCIGGMLGAL